MPDVVKLQVLSIGNTLPFLVLKSSNKKSTFYFDFQPSDFSCGIYNVNMKPQQMKLMLNGYHGLLKLKKKTTTYKKVGALHGPRYLSSIINTKIFHFLNFFH